MSHLKLDLLQNISFKDHQARENDIQLVETFIQAINQDIVIINQSIKAYNQTPDPLQKQQILRDIYQKLQALNNKYPLDLVNDCHEYVKRIQIGLYEQLNQQVRALKLNSMLDISDTYTRIWDGRDQFTDILANLTSQKLAEFVRFLSINGESSMQLSPSMLSDTESPSPELIHFLNTHTIEVIGRGNTILYKINDIEGEEEPFILKIEDRSAWTNEVKEMLIESQIPSLNQSLIANTLDRPITFVRQIEYPEYTMTASIVITDYCKHGDILHYVQQLDNPEEKISQTIAHGLQLQRILHTLQDRNIVFIDVKPENFLLDGEHRIRISDMKSLRFTGSGGLYYPNNHQNRWMSNHLPYTRYMAPPEVLKTKGLPSEPFSADKFHSYTLGKMLYVSLLSHSFDRETLSDCHDGNLYHFDDPIFETDQGKKFHLLIIESVKSNPEERLSLAEMSVLLTQIQNNESLDKMKDLIELKKIYRNISSQLPDLVLNHNDPTIALLVHDYQEQISGVRQKEELAPLQNEFLSAVEKINFIQKVNHCYILLEKLKELPFERQDCTMQQSIEAYKQQVKSAQSIEILDKIAKDLDNPNITAVKKYLYNLKKKLFSTEKVAKIIQSISNLPVEACSYIFTPVQQVPEQYRTGIEAVQQALNLKRNSFKNIMGSLSSALSRSQRERTDSISSTTSSVSIDRYRAAVSELRSSSRENSSETANDQASKGDEPPKLVL